MKEKILKYLSLFLTIVVVFTFVSCDKKGETNESTTEPEIEIGETVTTAAQATTESTEEITMVETTGTTDVVTETTEEETTTTTTTTTTIATTTEAPTTTAETEPQKPTAPTKKTDIINLYNDATAKVANKKPAFSKNRDTVAKSYKAGFALNAAKGLVYKFMGIGSENAFRESVSKNSDSYGKHFLKSTLKTSDVSNAYCKLDGKGDYTVTLYIKDGNSTVKNGKLQSINAPIDRCGISAGQNDKDYYDHKTAQNVYDAIDDVARNANISESYSNAVLTAVIDANGNLKSLKVTFDLAFDISNVYASSGTATASTTVNFSNFKW